MDDMHDERRDNPDTEHSRLTGDQVGEAVTGVSGAIVGAAIGSLGGPIGTVVGGIAGAVGGWWAGRAVVDAAEEYTLDDEAVYRNHYDNSPLRLADRKFDAARPAFRLGHIAARNPDYRGRSFVDVEPDLRKGWDSSTSKLYGDWASVRGYVNDAYDRKMNMIEREQLREKASNAADEDTRRLNANADLNLY
ncbi:MAG: hypothetical protein ABI119_00145 [Gemmatimonadaceae bacterium]